MIKKIINYLISGILIGSFCFLLVVLFLGEGFILTAKDIWVNWLMSALIGSASLIFEREGNFYLNTMMHYLLIFCIVNITALASHWVSFIASELLSLNLIMLVIYLLVWGILYLLNVISMKRINQQIKRKRQ